MYKSCDSQAQRKQKTAVCTTTLQRELKLPTNGNCCSPCIQKQLLSFLRGSMAVKWPQAWMNTVGLYISPAGQKRPKHLTSQSHVFSLRHQKSDRDLYKNSSLSLTFLKWQHLLELALVAQQHNKPERQRQAANTTMFAFIIFIVYIKSIKTYRIINCKCFVQYQESTVAINACKECVLSSQLKYWACFTSVSLLRWWLLWDNKVRWDWCHRLIYIETTSGIELCNWGYFSKPNSTLHCHMQIETPADTSAPSEQLDSSTEHQDANWEFHNDITGKTIGVATPQDESPRNQGTLETEGASLESSTNTSAGISKCGRVRTTSRKMADSVSQRKFYGNAQMYCMASEAIEG